MKTFTIQLMNDETTVNMHYQLRLSLYICSHMISVMLSTIHGTGQQLYHYPSLGGVYT